MAKKEQKCECECSKMDWITWILVLVGAVNWGLVGLFDLNLVSWLVGSMPVVEEIVYILVGLSAIYWIWKEWKKK